jgi:electron transfer flavoprotein alpha/beta subunit
MTEKKEGVVITIGAGGKVVPADSVAVEAARQIASETGETIIVSQVPEENEKDDGKPVQINPNPPPSKN